MRSMYRGFTISVFCIPLFNAIYFPVYEMLKKQFREKLGWTDDQARLYSLSAGLAGVCCNLMTNPLWLVRTRMQAEIFCTSSEEMYR
mmetsp:Transcript_5426/g.8403  ORF Transcript_5426/g.8403 Transcript_5426/m.8403 type:complete len:87 (+) Transcript_5426:209-469(+)